MEKVRPWLIPVSGSILCLTLAICAGILTHNARIGIHSVNDTLTDVKDYVHTEKATLEDPRNAKAIEAATQVGAVFNASGRLLNTQTIPRANKVLDDLATATVDLAAFTRHTDSQVNNDVLPATTAMIASADKLIADQDVHITDATTALARAAQGLSTAIETDNPKIARALDDIHTATLNADGVIKAFQPTATNLAGITNDFHGMTTDSRNKLHEIFWPAPKHGWARVGQVATYLLQPIFEGTRIYFSLRALPVRVTQPIPLK